jgi:hypothetical protein
MSRMSYRYLLLAAAPVLFAAPAHAQQGGRTVSFADEILPIFEKSCVNCHGGARRGGLQLDNHAGLMRGGAKGVDVVPGKPQESRLLAYLEGRATPRMPIGGAPLPPAQILLIRTWIAQGAKTDVQIPTAPVEFGDAKQKLTIAAPKDGSSVREKVTIQVPRDGVPPEGFVAIYVDGKFRAAVAPSSEEELAAKKLPRNSPISWVWDSKLPLPNASYSQEDQFLTDGPHVIEVRSYKGDGGEVERAQVNVQLANQLVTPSNRPVRLWYNGRQGQQYLLEHTVDLKASSAEAGARTARNAVVAAGPTRFTHKEVGKYLVSLEDLDPGTRVGFWRERRESPMVVVTNDLKQTIRTESSSRYYSVSPKGQTIGSKVMEREKRVPVINPIDLPGVPKKLSESFLTNLRLNLGAYIPGNLTVERLDAKVDGMEWQNGEPCARITLNYIAGSGKLDINTMRIQQADFSIQQGTSTIWFSEKSNRVIRAEHKFTGTLLVDVAQLGGSGGGAMPGSPGGEFAPGDAAPGAPGASMPYGGGAPGSAGMAGMMRGGPYGGGGAPGASGAPGSAGMASMMRGRGPGGASMPYGGGGAPGASMPYGGGAAGDSVGSFGGFAGGGASAAGDTGLPGPKKKTYTVDVTLQTRLLEAGSSLPDGTRGRRRALYSSGAATPTTRKSRRRVPRGRAG